MIVLEFAPDQVVNPFDRSIGLLLSFALGEKKAVAAFLYRYNPAARTLSLIKREGSLSHRLETAKIELSKSASAWVTGLQRPYSVASDPLADSHVGNFPEVLLGKLTGIEVIPLRNGNDFAGLLTVGWRGHVTPEAGEEQATTAIATALAALLVRSQKEAESLQLAAQVARLQAELADWKIADRTQGLLSVGQDARSAALVVSRHVSRVLGGDDIENGLREERARLESELRDRQLISEAKALLQREHKLSEEQAYIQLRNQSRKTRRALAEIADDILRPDRLSA